MAGKQQSAAMRIGGFVGRAYQGYASAEGQLLGLLPRSIAFTIRVVLRAAVVATLLYFLFVPTLLVLCAIGVISKIRAGETVGDLVSQPSYSEAELFEGNEGFGLYKDGARIG
ncbi:TPA: DUF3742 family protein [Pseudomonas aeruginosa]|jgi:hypothetical protein|nr:hypothetical protein PXNS11_140038 [Stutzerimonas xanthomarina]